MGTEAKQVKKPMSNSNIYRIMLWITFAVAGVFLLKNLIAFDAGGAIAIGACLAVFAVVVFLMKMMKVKDETKQMVVSVGLLFVVFIISLFSGACYSDDFLLYAAVLALAGMFLKPKYTVIQGVVATVLLILQYIIHPEKAESLGQYIMCLAIFVLLFFLFRMVIKRGSAYIERSNYRAAQAEKLIDSIHSVGEELQKNYEISSSRMENMKDANAYLERNAQDLRDGSSNIAEGARTVLFTCNGVQEKIQTTEEQISSLNDELRGFESAMALNRKNMDEMNRQMAAVKVTMQETNNVFRILEEQMLQIQNVTKQLNSISSSTTMLALNASIEAARAGHAGAGFAVVASKVQELAVDSNRCSSEVEGVVAQMQEQILTTTSQLEESAEAINESLSVLDGLQNGFDHLTAQFGSLYENSEAQNTNVAEVDNIVEELKQQIADMDVQTDDNQISVEAIAEALNVYQENMKLVIEDTQVVQQLSANMLEIAKEENEEE